MDTRPDLDVELLLRRLTARGVDFVIIGGVAATLFGSPRTTFDLDICFETDPTNLESLGEVLTGLGARLRGVPEDLPFTPDATTLSRIEVLTMSTRAGDIDVLSNPKGAPPYARLRAQAERLLIGDFAVLVASLEDLIAMKRAVGRPKDLLDIEELEAIRRLRRRVKPKSG